MQIRWDLNVDGDSFVKERFGSLLKSGLTIAGRHYDFLAFSNSGLKEHSVSHGTTLIPTLIRSGVVCDSILRPKPKTDHGRGD